MFVSSLIGYLPSDPLLSLDRLYRISAMNNCEDLVTTRNDTANTMQYIEYITLFAVKMRVNLFGDAATDTIYLHQFIDTRRAHRPR